MKRHLLVQLCLIGIVCLGLLMGTAANDGHIAAQEATPEPTSVPLIGQIAFSVHIDGGALYLLNIDENRQIVAPQLLDTGGVLISSVAWSSDGKYLALQAQYPDRDYTEAWAEIAIMTVDEGHIQRLPPTEHNNFLPVWSPDDEYLLYSRTAIRDTLDLYLTRSDGSGRQLLLDNDFSRAGSEHYPAWSSTGWVAFDANWNDRNDIYIMQMDGLTPLYDTLQLVTPMDGNHFLADWSPDGTYIVFQSDMDAVNSGSYDLYLVEVASGEIERLTFTEDSEHMPRWSPDGRFIAYTSGRPRNIYIMDLDTREVWRAMDIPESVASLDWRPVLPTTQSATEE